MRRACAPDSSITLVGEEIHLPYQRPPLSKAFLTGEVAAERLALKPQTWYEAQSISLKRGVAVTRIDRQQRQVVLADGEQLVYDKLVLATGSRPRMLPASLAGNLSRRYALRGIDDAHRLKCELVAGRRVLVIGGGYVGLEFAASAAKAGLKIVLVEAAERILGRVASAETADYFRALHTSHGVEILEGVGVQALEEVDGLTRVSLSNGRELDVDFTVVGIGAVANDHLAVDCGLDTRNGVLIDVGCRSSDPHILAAGDCATVLRDGAASRTESVQNAIEQGETAAHTVAGLQAPPGKTPWFWSDQYDAKLQIAGINCGYDRTEVRAGGRPGAQSVWYYAGERLLAVDAINGPVTYMTVRRQLDTLASTSASAPVPAD